MRRTVAFAGVFVLLPLTGLVLACLQGANDPAPPAGPSIALQFTTDELAQHAVWEKFLETAEVVKSEQMIGPQSVTSPWKLWLKLGDVEHKGLWKNAAGRMGGFWEGWQYEISAYRFDKLLGLGMVPPTVERRFNGDRGSCQYWVDNCLSLLERDEKRIKMPPAKVAAWNRATYLQRLFDNLIANEDRHKNQILITPDWRMILIDHSRSFRTSSRFVKSLLYSAKSPGGPMLMSELPRVLVDKVRALDFAAIRAAVGEYLTDEEVRAVLVRRDLVLAEIAQLIKVNGEKKVLY